MILAFVAALALVTPVPNPRFTDTRPLVHPVVAHMHAVNQALGARVFTGYSISSDGSELFLKVDCKRWEALKKSVQAQTLAATEQWWGGVCDKPRSGKCAIGVADNCNHWIKQVPIQRG